MFDLISFVFGLGIILVLIALAIIVVAILVLFIISTIKLIITRIVNAKCKKVLEAETKAKKEKIYKYKQNCILIAKQKSEEKEYGKYLSRYEEYLNEWQKQVESESSFFSPESFIEFSDKLIKKEEEERIQMEKQKKRQQEENEFKNKMESAKTYEDYLSYFYKYISYNKWFYRNPLIESCWNLLCDAKTSGTATKEYCDYLYGFKGTNKAPENFKDWKISVQKKKEEEKKREKRVHEIMEELKNERVPCDNCNGIGRSLLSSTGFVQPGSIYDREDICPECNGTGRCPRFKLFIYSRIYEPKLEERARYWEQEERNGSPRPSGEF